MFNHKIYSFIISFMMMVLLTNCTSLYSGRWYDSELNTVSLWYKDKYINIQNPPPQKPVAKKIPLKDVVVVHKGDSYYGIARRHNVSMRDLIEANFAHFPYQLEEGQQLILPNAQKYVILSGDTVYSISRRHEVSMDVLVRLNHLQDPYILSIGQTIKIPHGQYKKLSKIYEKLARIVPHVKTKFITPVQGEMISRYGLQSNGAHNDGINIAIPVGTSVKASEKGVVVYAGSDLEGYGKLLLIKHAHGYLTAYAHIRDFLVKPNDSVTRGEIIAKSGQSGHVSKPQLHFEIRQGRHTIDPLKFI